MSKSKRSERIAKAAFARNFDHVSIPCSECGGSGTTIEDNERDTCPSCDGSGIEESTVQKHPDGDKSRYPTFD